MDIKELCRLCSKYETNKTSLSLEYSFKNRSIGKLNDSSESMKIVNSRIAFIEGENKMIEKKIKNATGISFDWL